MIKNHIKTLIFGILAAFSIALGGTLFLVCKDTGKPILGGFLFPIGLLLILCFSFNLFTGKIGYVFRKKKDYLLDLLLIYLGNIIGSLIYGLILRLTNKTLLDSVGLATAAAKLLNINGTGKTWYSLLLGGMVCGMLVYLAVESFKSEKLHPIFRISLVILCIAAFVIAGFEHCIADMFYFAFAGTFYGENWWIAIISILIITIGNSLGSIILDYLMNFNKKEAKDGND